MIRYFSILYFFLLSIALVGQRKPVTGVPVVNPEDLGFDLDSLDALDDMIDNEERSGSVGLVVIKNNQLVMEWYYNQFWRNHIHDIRSAGKSITAVLLRVAIQNGFVNNLEESVYSFFPREKYPQIHKDYKRVKLIHLLNMLSGLDANSDDARTPGHAGRWLAKDDWLNYLLSIPLAFDPGERWAYADINVALIGAIIEEKSGLSLKDFAKKYVFDPLEIKEYYWYTNAADQTTAAGNLYISSLDFAKLGLLVANKGKWINTQIADPVYMSQLLEERTPAIGNYNPLADAYGFLWYKSKRRFGDKEAEYLWASGNGGNHLIIVPKEDMVIAITSGAYANWHPHIRAYTILGKIINALN